MMMTTAEDFKVSSSDHTKRTNKPLMEKRRRARINHSLMELKSILIDAMKKNTPGHSKWEKADILEMTVHYLQSLQNQQKATKTDPLALGQYIAGFSECVRQTQKVSKTLSVDDRTQQQISEHLLSCLNTFSDDTSKAIQQHQHNNTCDAAPAALRNLVPAVPHNKKLQTGGDLTANGNGSIEVFFPILPPSLSIKTDQQHQPISIQQHQQQQQQQRLPPSTAVAFLADYTSLSGIIPTNCCTIVNNDIRVEQQHLNTSPTASTELQFSPSSDSNGALSPMVPSNQTVEINNQRAVKKERSEIKGSSTNLWRPW